MKAIGCQFDIAWENKQANFESVHRLLTQTDITSGDLVVLPEMFATGFSMNVSGIAEPMGGTVEQFMRQTAQEFGVYVIGGVVTPSADGRGRNEAVCFCPAGREIMRYAKMHCFNPVGEGEHFEAGQGTCVFPIGEWQVAPFICYDLRFPEVFRSATFKGAELIVVMANWPTVRIQHWMALLQARAIENQAYVIGVNRCGTTPKIDYCGRSLVVDPLGRAVADAGTGEACVCFDLDRAALLEYRRNFAVLNDMRMEYIKKD